ncbi:MAG: phage head closure protein [Candidatus Rokubacteria bacterium]|nr:phage head closure protein [Candidatus Rokubacteria bacterium]
MSRLSRLNRRLVLEAPERAEDGAGGADVTWSEVATLWAEVAPAGGREALRAEAVTAEATHRITIRRRRDVAPAMRFREGARHYDIVAVLPDYRERRWTVCLVRERPVT